MAKINEFGEIIRNSKEHKNSDRTIPTFSPPKMELEHVNKGDEILHTGKYEYRGIKYDLQTLENLAERLEDAIRIQNDDDVLYAEEVLTIIIQMLKKANMEIVESSQANLTKEEKLSSIQDKQYNLQKDGIILNAATLLRSPEKAQEYIMALQEEMAKQKSIDTQRQMKETKEFLSKMPNISSEPTSVDIEER